MAAKWSVVSLLVLTSLLAGCTGSDGDDATLDEGPDKDLDDQAPLDDVVTEDAPLVIEQLPVSWNGSMGTFIVACETASWNCADHEASQSDNDWYHEQPGARIQSVSIELTWNAETPATQELGLGIMAMGLCEECNTTVIGEATGPSLLTINADGLDILLEEEVVLHAYVWNDQAYHHQDPLFLYGSNDQPFTLTGQITLASGGEEPKSA